MMVPLLIEMFLDSIAGEKMFTACTSCYIQRNAVVEHCSFALKYIDSKTIVFSEAFVYDTSRVSIELSILVNK
jgi:hypothetical protein